MFCFFIPGIINQLTLDVMLEGTMTVGSSSLASVMLASWQENWWALFCSPSVTLIQEHTWAKWTGIVKVSCSTNQEISVNCRNKILPVFSYQFWPVFWSYSVHCNTLTCCRQEHFTFTCVQFRNRPWVSSHSTRWNYPRGQTSVMRDSRESIVLLFCLF